MPGNNITIVYRKVDELIPYANNPRDNTKAIDAVAKSIRRFGVRSPAIVDKNGVLIAGHTRLLAAKKLGLKEFPVVVADDLTPEQANMYRLMDNRAQEESQWDSDLLSSELKDLKLSGFDLSDTGFTPFEIDSLTFEFDAAPSQLRNPINTYTTGSAEQATIPGDPTSAGEYGSVHRVSDLEQPEEDDELPYSTYNGDPQLPAREPAVQAAPAQDKFAAFACIICCATLEERRFVRELLHEDGDLKQRYNMRDILEKLL